ncbi:hypothetical protein FORC82_p188 (plasmid) [Escherichia coli]|nr:hypothetical protein FORC82_p188 [Escherichia coli]
MIKRFDNLKFTFLEGKDYIGDMHFDKLSAAIDKARSDLMA